MINNHFKYSVTIIFFTTFLLSCNDQVVENDLDYKEKVVIRSLIESGKPIQVYFGKTFPPNQAFNPDEAYLDNVDAVISAFEKNYKLEHIGNGIYTNENILAVNGIEYELKAVWNSDSILSKTYIPYSTTFQKAQLIENVSNENDTTYYLQGFLSPRENAVYGATWVILNAEDTVRIEDEVIPNLAREQDANLAGLLLIRTRNISKELVDEYRNSLFIRVHAFDEVFYNYFITQNANNASTNIFSQSGINLRWNVEGNAIGLFIGKSDFIVKIP